MPLEEEALRYLGYKGQADEATRALISRVLSELEGLASFAYAAVFFDAAVSENTVTLADGYKIESIDLARHLKGCKRVILFAATLGVGADRGLQRYLKTEIAVAAAFQACAAALLEEHCDRAQDSLTSPDLCDMRLSSRFSPGYGDFSLHHQEALLKRLDAGRKLGLSCTSQAMLVPTKSVTALIGVDGGKAGAAGCGDCASCAQKNCPLRRGEL